MHRGIVKETLNAMLDEQADEMCNAHVRLNGTNTRRTRIDTGAGSYTGKLYSKAGEFKASSTTINARYRLVSRRSEFEGESAVGWVRRG